MNALGWTAGLAIALLAQAGAYAGESVGGIYTCVDANGRRITSDRPIAACIDREQRELGPSGAVRRVIGPTLTEHERASQAEQRRKEQDERNRVADERRLERVLVTRYPDRQAHDAERKIAMEKVDSLSELAIKRMAELRGGRKALDAEMEFYKRDPLKAPVKLQRQVAANEAEMDEQRRFLLKQDEEKLRIHKRFDAELAHLRRLWGERSAVPSLLPAAAGTAAR